MPEPIPCDLCGVTIQSHGFYIVSIDVFADPSTPPLDTSKLSDKEAARSMSDVLKELGNLSADELQDSVHRHFEHRLCAKCHRLYLANPLGKPRSQAAGVN